MSEREAEARLKIEEPLAGIVAPLVDCSRALAALSSAPEPGDADFDDMEGRGPCGGSRCFKSHADGVWIHSSKSYDSCAVNIARVAPPQAGAEGGEARNG